MPIRSKFASVPIYLSGILLKRVAIGSSDLPYRFWHWLSATFNLYVALPGSALHGSSNSVNSFNDLNLGTGVVGRNPGSDLDTVAQRTEQGNEGNE